ncbi:uncharacterized protein LOC105211822 [Zeugodacus cucurbitae]|uniref:Uncharacterized protein MSANTD1 n=1 Tax=Zeugodacus cucurbitae TaxID=28588 RepID=A0A0A1WW84_ZEUCU|nr:uncharacterized protein LOC105211822 [Zeugodacus cucurbitae]
MESATKKRRRRNFWDNTTEAYFVDLWAQKIDELRSDKRNTQVYQEMSVDLATHGLELSVPDIKYKIANLTTKYRKCREALESTAGDAPVLWPLYEQVHQIIGSQTFNHTDMSSEGSVEHKFNLAEASFLTPLAASLSTPSYDSNTFTLPPPYITDLPSSTRERAPKRRSSEKSKIISMCACLQATAEEKNKLMKEMVQVEKEKLEVLKDLRDDNKKLTQAIINYLSRKQ